MENSTLTENKTALPEPEEVPAYSKGQLLKSKRYHKQRDILSALLVDGRQYTHKDVEEIIKKFMKGRVK